MANSPESLTGLLQASGLSGSDSLNTHMTSLADQLQQQHSINVGRIYGRFDLGHDW
jgi:hypothetical protein